MNKTRGLYNNRNFLNSRGNSLYEKRGLKTSHERALKDIQETNFYKNMLQEIIQQENNEKVVSVSNDKENIAVLAPVESAVSGTELFELNFLNNINIPVTQRSSDLQKSEEYETTTVEVPINKETNITSNTEEVENENEESVIESALREEQDEEEEQLQQIKEENYRNFVIYYEVMLDMYKSEFINKIKDKLNNKLENIRNDNDINNYSVDDMLNMMKQTIIVYLEHDRKDIKKKMQTIENKDENKNKSKDKISSKTYKKHNDNIEEIDNIIKTINEFTIEV